MMIPGNNGVMHRRVEQLIRGGLNLHIVAVLIGKAILSFVSSLHPVSPTHPKTNHTSNKRADSCSHTGLIPAYGVIDLDSSGFLIIIILSGNNPLMNITLTFPKHH